MKASGGEIFDELLNDVNIRIELQVTKRCIRAWKEALNETAMVIDNHTPIASLRIEDPNRFVVAERLLNCSGIRVGSVEWSLVVDWNRSVGAAIGVSLKAQGQIGDALRVEMFDVGFRERGRDKRRLRLRRSAWCYFRRPGLVCPSYSCAAARQDDSSQKD